MIANAATHEAISCDCRGWTQRVDRTTGLRTCTHCKQQNEKAPVLRDANTHGIVAATKRLATPAVKPTQEPLAAEPPRRTNPQLASAMVAGQGIATFVGNPDWVLEEKFDGHRVMVRVVNDTRGLTVDAWSRPRAGGDGPLTRQLPRHIVTALLELPPGVYDGELRIPGGHAWDVTRTDRTEELQLVLFDVVECLGDSVAHLADRTRRSYLEVAFAHIGAQAVGPNGEGGESLLEDLRPVTLAERLPVSQEAVQAIWLGGGEGAILKRLSATYRPGYRTDAWVKVKKSATLAMQITGFANGKRGPYSVTEVRGTIAGEEVRTSVTTGAGNLDVIRNVEANPDAWLGEWIVVSYAETITDTISRRPGMSRIQLRHPIWDHVAAAHERA